MDTTVINVLQYVGIFAFAVSGALVGVQRRLDLLGIVVVGVSTGVGGGIVRDILVGVNPPVSLLYWPNICVAAGGAVLVFFLSENIAKFRKVEVFFDAMGLGIFAANGAAVGLASGFSPFTAVILGTITAIGGGVVRDVLVNRIPGVLSRELYAVSAVLGATCAVLCLAWGISVSMSSLLGAAATMTLRLLSISYGWHLPRTRHNRASD